MTGGDELDALTGAYHPGFKYHDENLLMLSWYAERMIGCLRSARPRSLLSLGLGHRVVSRALLGLVGDPVEEYTIVEGSGEAIRLFREGGTLPPGVRLEHALFEEYEPARPLDAVEMGFVLEHVEDPALVLRRYARFLQPPGVIVIVVPNARALHRLVGQRAGLLDDVHRLSEHDLRLGHRRYFDLGSVRRLVEEAGLEVRKVEGVFLKCATTAQLESLALPASVLRGYCEVGIDYPEIANAIYLEAGL